MLIFLFFILNYPKETVVFFLVLAIVPLLIAVASGITDAAREREERLRADAQRAEAERRAAEARAEAERRAAEARAEAERRAAEGRAEAKKREALRREEADQMAASADLIELRSDDLTFIARHSRIHADRAAQVLARREKDERNARREMSNELKRRAERERDEADRNRAARLATLECIDDLPTPDLHLVAAYAPDRAAKASAVLHERTSVERIRQASSADLSRMLVAAITEDPDSNRALVELIDRSRRDSVYARGAWELGGFRSIIALTEVAHSTSWAAERARLVLVQLEPRP